VLPAAGKLPPTWKNFATSLKHGRKEFGLTELMGTLDVKEKARAKNTYGKVLSLLVPIWCRTKSNMYSVTRKRTSNKTSRG